MDALLRRGVRVLLWCFLPGLERAPLQSGSDRLLADLAGVMRPPPGQRKVLRRERLARRAARSKPSGHAWSQLPRLGG